MDVCPPNDIPKHLAWMLGNRRVPNDRKNVPDVRRTVRKSNRSENITSIRWRFEIQPSIGSVAKREPYPEPGVFKGASLVYWRNVIAERFRGERSLNSGRRVSVMSCNCQICVTGLSPFPSRCKELVGSRQHAPPRWRLAKPSSMRTADHTFQVRNLWKCAPFFSTSTVYAQLCIPIKLHHNRL